MTDYRRHHPAQILFKIGKMLRNWFFFILILFVLQAGNSSPIIVYGRYGLLLVFLWSTISIVLNWLTTTYANDDQRFYLKRGIFSKTEQSIPFSKVQNINSHTSFFHRLLGLTSISFETGIAGEDSSVKFDVAAKKEAARLEAAVQEHKETIAAAELALPDDSPLRESEDEAKASPKLSEERVIHFQPSRRDLLKASMTSLSFLLLVPLLGSLYYNVSEYIGLEERLTGIGGSIVSSPWIIAAVVGVIVLASLLFGIVHTFIKYGKYEISSDSQRVYIKKGMVSQASFSIAKERVQAVEVTQTFIKRVLGLAEVKLISAGSVSLDQEDLNISSLYPFLPKEKAYTLIAELLPGYRIQEQMKPLPRRALWVRLLKPSLFWLFATAALFYFQPEFLGIENTWWMASILLLTLILVSRFLDFLHTRYCLNDELIQFKDGGFTTSLFVTKREKIVEVAITQNRIQRALGLSSLRTVTRARPVHNSYLNDVPDSMTGTFQSWYRGRSKEVRLNATK